MSAWRLPTSVVVDEKTLSVRSDFRAVLDALAALQDPVLEPENQIAAFLTIFYPELPPETDIEKAFAAAMKFVDCGREPEKTVTDRPRLVNWEQDADLIAPAVDEVLGYSCRRCPYLHWWEFVGAYQNIGDGLFAQVVGIRKKRAEGRPLTKEEQSFLQNNRRLIGDDVALTDAEKEFLKELGV